MAFQQAQNDYNNTAGVKGPTDFTAQFTPDMLAAFQKQANYGMADNPAVTNATNAGTALTGAGTNAVTSGLNTLGGFTPDQIAQNNIDAANKYVAGQNIPGQVDAAMHDAIRSANENAIPAIQRAAAGSGNVNSSRAALSQGVVERGLAEQAGNLSTQLRAQAYNNGLNLGQQGNASAITAALGGATAGNAAAGTGVNAGTAAVNNQNNLFNLADTAQKNQLAGSQADLTNQLQQQQHATNDPWQALNNYFNLVGAKSWGGETTGNSTTNTQQTPSGMSILGGLLSGVGGMGLNFGTGGLSGALGGLFGGGASAANTGIAGGGYLGTGGQVYPGPGYYG